LAKLIEQNTVILGSLNPAIIQPNWLTKIGIIPLGVQVQAKYKIGSNLPGEFAWDIYKWTVDYGMMKVHLKPDQSPDQLNNFVSKIFESLSHTPVSAIGHNFIFEDNSGSFRDPPIKENWGIGEKTKWGSVINLVEEITLIKDDVTKIRINLNQHSDAKRISFNFHSDVTNVGQLLKFSQQCKENLSVAESLLEELKK
jgi:hypothetical protein